MRMYHVFYIGMICAVAVDNIQTVEIRKVKRQTTVEDKWSWGFVEITPPIKNESQTQLTPVTINYNNGQNVSATLSQIPTASPDSKEPVECRSEYKPPTKPDYRKPGRRISEAKCYEYIWELNDRVQTVKRLNACTEYYNSLSSGDVGGAVGGRPTAAGEFPHMGAVGWKATIGTWVFKCGSTLISDKFVLTAGHCTRASSRDTTISDPVPQIIRLGDKKITDDEKFTPPSNTFKDVDISRIIVHPQYKPPKKYYDIALMELQYTVEFSKLVQPACLWNKFSTNDLGQQATATGWGVVESGSLDISPELQAVTFDILDTALCNKLLEHNRNRNWNGMQDHQLCAGNLTGGVDSCQGDSGGPLQMKIPLPKNVTDQEGSLHYVVGVISFGVGCGRPNLPGIYTRVSSFVDWIEGHVWKHQGI